METKTLIEKMLKGKTPEEAFKEIKDNTKIKVTLTKRNINNKK